MYLILIETSGNQNYIFSSNKLRENIGASELTYRAGTQWVLEAVAEEGGPELWTKTNQKLRNNLLHKSEDIEGKNSKYEIEVIVATSGKALLLVKDKEIGKNLIRKISLRALKYAPGLDICGVIQEFDFDNKKLSEVNREIHQEFETVRSKKPSPLARFLRLPVVDECNTSGLGASELGKVGENFVPLSSVSAVKRDGTTNSDALKRVESILYPEKPTKEPSLRFPRNVNELEKIEEREWLSVIHADGNGLGEIILKFDLQLRQEDSIAVQNRNYINKLRRFSLALDVCTENAFITAVKSTFEPEKPKDENTKKNVIPLVPLVLGGDDLTVVCDGKQALDFTKNFLLAFEEETQKDHLESIIPKVAEIALGVPRLSACAGVAIIKPHFPFYNAYNLAEELMKSAKTIKKKLQRNEYETPWPSSALDFHVLYDSSASELKFIRQQLEIDLRDKVKTKNYGKPYVVTPKEWLEREASDLINSSTSLEWVNFHHWQQLKDRVYALKDEDDEQKRKLPRSQMSDLRSGLFLGKEEADALLNLIWNRYKDLGLKDMVIYQNPASLFWSEMEEDKDKKEKKPVWVTNFLDAVDAADFLDNAVNLLTSEENK